MSGKIKIIKKIIYSLFIFVALMGWILILLKYKISSLILFILAIVIFMVWTIMELSEK